MTFHSWVFRRWVFYGWVLHRWVFEAYCREYPTRNLELGIPDVGHSRRWVFQRLGIPYENRTILILHDETINDLIIVTYFVKGQFGTKFCIRFFYTL